MFPQAAAGSTEALVDVGFAREQPLRNLTNVEAAEGLQSQRQLRLHGDRLVAADKQHPKQVVTALPRQQDLRNVLRKIEALCAALLQDSAAPRSLAQVSDEVVVR